MTPALTLAAATSSRWVQAAAGQWRELLLDHAACEKKAASSALAMIFAYPERAEDNLRLARLAREELRHFEQVSRLMGECGVPFRRARPARYAGELRRALATAEPQRRLDLLLINALIEARSCERFRLLAPVLPGPLGAFYHELARSEERHAAAYVELACRDLDEAQRALLARRLGELAALEAQIISQPEQELRFHSGPPP